LCKVRPHLALEHSYRTRPEPLSSQSQAPSLAGTFYPRTVSPPTAGSIAGRAAALMMRHWLPSKPPLRVSYSRTPRKAVPFRPSTTENTGFCMRIYPDSRACASIVKGLCAGAFQGVAGPSSRTALAVVDPPHTHVGRDGCHVSGSDPTRAGLAGRAVSALCLGRDWYDVVFWDVPWPH